MHFVNNISLSKKKKKKIFRFNDIFFRKNEFVAIYFEFRLIRKFRRFDFKSFFLSFDDRFDFRNDNKLFIKFFVTCYNDDEI